MYFKIQKKFYKMGLSKHIINNILSENMSGQLFEIWLAQTTNQIQK